jgi:hypothetical protein
MMSMYKDVLDYHLDLKYPLPTISILPETAHRETYIPATVG